METIYKVTMSINGKMLDRELKQLEVPKLDPKHVEAPLASYAMSRRYQVGYKNSPELIFKMYRNPLLYMTGYAESNIIKATGHASLPRKFDVHEDAARLRKTHIFAIGGFVEHQEEGSWGDAAEARVWNCVFATDALCFYTQHEILELFVISDAIPKIMAGLPIESMSLMQPGHYVLPLTSASAVPGIEFFDH